MLAFIIFGFVSWLVDAFLWGTTGYVVYRYLNIKRKRRIYAIVVWTLLYFFWDEIVINQVALGTGVTFRDSSFQSIFAQNDIFTTDLFDLILSFGIIFGGFELGEILVEKAK